MKPKKPKLYRIAVYTGAATNRKVKLFGDERRLSLSTAAEVLIEKGLATVTMPANQNELNPL